MTTKTISSLPLAPTLVGSEMLPIDQFNADGSLSTRRTSLSSLFASSVSRRAGYINVLQDYGTSQAAMTAAISDAMSQGKDMRFMRGIYGATDTLGFGNVSKDLAIYMEAGAVIQAQAGFPAGKKLVQFTGGAGCRIKWEGGKLDASNVPNSTAGQANDALSFNTSGSELISVEDVDLYAGTDFMVGGSDSGIFAAWATEMSFKRIRVQGFPDSGMYLSGGSTGDGTGEFSENISFDMLDFNGCNNGLIIKRRFRRVSGGTVFTTDCASGIIIGGEAALGNGTTDLTAQDASIQTVIARRTGNAVTLRCLDNGFIGSVITRDMGCVIVSGAGYTSGGGIAVLLQGANRCQVASIVADGVNPALTGSPVTNALQVLDRTVNGVTRHSTNNVMRGIKAKAITQSIHEFDANQSGNIYEITSETGVGSSSTPTSATSTIINPLLTIYDGSNMTTTTAGNQVLIAPNVALGGAFGAESLRASNVANAVQRVVVTGALTAAASGPIIGAAGETNVALTVAAKGTGNLYLGGAAGAEGVRIAPGVASGTAIQITPAAAGSGVTLAARGGNTDEVLNLNSKGAARIVFNNRIGLKSYTVATLPAGTQGDIAYVTDALAPTWGATLVTGGAVKCLAFYNGAAWVGA